MRSRTTVKRQAHERGAHLVELSLALVVFLLLLLAIFDFARLMTVQHLLLKGAQDGLSLAERVVGAEIDTRPLSPDDPQYQTFLKAREAILRVAVQSPKALLASSATEGRSANSFIGFRHQDHLAGGAVRFVPETGSVDALFLRPGESAVTVVDGNVDATVRHPIATIPPGQEWSTTLASAPVMVQLCAEVHWAVVPPFRTCQRALGFLPATTPRLPTAPPVLAPRAACEGSSCGSPKVWDEDACSCACTNSCTLPKALNTNTCGCECLNQSTCLSPFTLNGTTCSCDCICPPPRQAMGSGCSCQCPADPPSGYQCQPAKPTWDTEVCGCVCNLNDTTCSAQGESFDPKSCSCQANTCTNTCNTDTHTGPSGPDCQCTCKDQSPCPSGQTRDPNTCQCTGGQVGTNSCITRCVASCNCVGSAQNPCEGQSKTEYHISSCPAQGKVACNQHCGCASTYTTTLEKRCNNDLNRSCTADTDCN